MNYCTSAIVNTCLDLPGSNAQCTRIQWEEAPERGFGSRQDKSGVTQGQKVAECTPDTESERENVSEKKERERHPLIVLGQVTIVLGIR